ncbi:MAG: hypothetical protein Q7N95_04075 [Alphaproteobacteria bacterium]|nr:hypothetical protein [Alphaproteobacteria bacterium]
MIRQTHLPEYYVMLCARRYAEMAKKLVVAVNENERTQAKNRLAYILESGLIEFKHESERRLRAYPDDFRKALLEKDGSVISRSISREESEILRYACAVPTFTLIDNLSAVEMQDLADMFEGWAQSDRMDCVNVAMFHGYADGLRSLVEAVGPDFIPPPAPPGAPVSLMKFMALRMRQ